MISINCILPKPRFAADDLCFRAGLFAANRCRFWALGLCLYQYLDSLRQRLQRLENQHVSLGEARAWVIARHEDRQLD